MDKNKLIFILGLIIFIFFGIYSYYSNVKDYINDSIFFSVILILLFFIRKKINLTPISFSLLILALLSHLSGVFGFYNNSPILIQYDHFTHFIGLFATSILIYNLMEKYFTKNKYSNFFIILIIFFTSLGIGSLIEQVEYIGYLKFGTGAGLFKFGGLGDTIINEENLRDIDIIGGGWINTMLDLNYNFIGSLAGIIFIYLINKFKQRK